MIRGTIWRGLLGTHCLEHPGKSIRSGFVTFPLIPSVGILLLAPWVLLAGCRPDRGTAQRPSLADPAVLAAGAELYSMNCAQCHLDGSSTLGGPGLAASLAAKPDFETVARAVLRGVELPASPESGGMPRVMPAMDWMSDAEVLAVTTYVRQQFAGLNESIAESEVARLRGPP